MNLSTDENFVKNINNSENAGSKIKCKRLMKNKSPLNKVNYTFITSVTDGALAMGKWLQLLEQLTV